MEPHFNVARPVKGVASAEAIESQAQFQPLPAATGKAPYHLDLKSVIAATDYNTIEGSKMMAFHLTADVGGVKIPADQVLVTDHMEMQFDKNSPLPKSSFLYLAGDVVYYYGQLSEYNAQFYEPYKFYPAPIFAIPGNHDGDVDPTDASKPATLAAFIKLFCAKKATVPAEAGDSTRTTMTQPNVYWTLVTPVANIIGLYTNVPEGGKIDDDQRKWFIKELVQADKERKTKAVVVTLHHPPFSMDAHHGASAAMQQFLEAAFKEAKVLPDIVFSGHVHNYQRFTKKEANKDVPYIVAGAGGYWHLHNINTSTNKVTAPGPSSFAGVDIEKYCEDRHGFLYLTIDMNKKKIKGEYYTVPRMHEAWKADAVLFDTFTVDLASGKVI